MKSNLNHINNYNQLLEQLKNDNYNYNKEVKVFNAAAGYSPLLYIFSGFGIFIGKLLNLHPIIIMYIGRLFNFVIYITCGYFAIKKIPFCKLVLLTYLLLPMVLQQAISISADSIINSISILFISLILYLSNKNIGINKSEIILYFLLIMFISVSKVVYMPLIFLSLLLIKNKKITKNQKVILIIGTILILMIFWLGTYYISSQYIDERPYISENNVNGLEQVKYILKNPLEYILVIIRTLKVFGKDYIYTFIGRNLGWLNIIINKYVILLFGILFLASPLFDEKEKTISRLQIIIFITVCCSIFILCLTGLYIGWTGVGNDIVLGIQGRYFIPIFILPLLCVNIKNINNNINKKVVKYAKIIYPIILIVLNLNVLKVIISFFSKNNI